MGALIALILGLSAAVTLSVDWIRNIYDVAIHPTTPPHPWVWSTVAILVGVGFELGEFSSAVNFAPGIVALVPRLAPHAADLSGFTGELISGLILGGLAGFGHDVRDFFASGAKASRSQAGLTPRG